MKRRNYFKKLVAVFTICIFSVTVNAGVVFGAQSDMTYYEKDATKIEIKTLNSTDGIISYEDNTTGENFSINIYNSETGELYAETHDQEGNLVNKVIQNKNVITVYDPNGNILAETSFETSESAVSIMQADSAYTWEDYIANVTGNTKFRDYAMSTIASAMLGSIGGMLLIGNPTGLFATAIEQAADWVFDHRPPAVYYRGTKQLGWSYATRVAHVIFGIYPNANYTNRIDTIDKIVPVH